MSLPKNLLSSSLTSVNLIHNRAEALALQVGVVYLLYGILYVLIKSIKYGIDELGAILYQNSSNSV